MTAGKCEQFLLGTENFLQAFGAYAVFDFRVSGCRA